jgi:proteasome lid subunit RPN8/RPN11
MKGLTAVVDRLAARYDERTLARMLVWSALLVAAILLFLLWYFGNVGLTMAATGSSDDDRTVVVDVADLTTFEEAYDERREVGWCLYGTTNETHVRIDRVVQADPLRQEPGRIEFTCIPETGTQLVSGRNPRLVGVVHSHPNHDRSYLSRTDLVLWARLSPAIEVMGVYTESDGVAFFTMGSLQRPLEMTLRFPDERTVEPGGSGVSSPPLPDGCGGPEDREKWNYSVVDGCADDREGGR